MIPDFLLFLVHSIPVYFLCRPWLVAAICLFTFTAHVDHSSDENAGMTGRRRRPFFFPVPA
jgi:hypothetical protein